MTREKCALSPNEEQLKEEVDKLMAEYEIAHERFTKSQLADAFIQALKAGDFERYVAAGTNNQIVVYLPFREKFQLQARIRFLEDKLKHIEHIANPEACYQGFQ